MSADGPTREVRRVLRKYQNCAPLTITRYISLRQI